MPAPLSRPSLRSRAFSAATTVASEEDLDLAENHNLKSPGTATLAPEAEWIYYNEEDSFECEPRVECKPISLDGKTALTLKVQVEGFFGILGSCAPALPISDVIDDCFL